MDIQAPRIEEAPDTLLINDDRPYSWMSDEEYEWYKKLEENQAWQDSSANILSSRLGKTLKMKDILAQTYTDGSDVYYWNQFWGDLVKVPDGFTVDQDVNWFWHIPHGTSFHGVVDGKDTLTVYVYSAYQMVYDSDEDFRERYLDGIKEDRQLDIVSSEFKYGTITLKDGSRRKYLYCVYEGINQKTGKGEYHKDIRCLPDVTLHEITVVYPLPKRRKVAAIIKELSSYPNITDYSHLSGDIQE